MRKYMQPERKKRKYGKKGGDTVGGGASIRMLSSGNGLYQTLGEKDRSYMQNRGFGREPRKYAKKSHELF